MYHVVCALLKPIKIKSVHVYHMMHCEPKSQLMKVGICIGILTFFLNNYFLNLWGTLSLTGFRLKTRPLPC